MTEEKDPKAKSGEEEVIIEKVPRDPRVDKLFSWMLGIAATTALSVGGWWSLALQSEVKESRSESKVQFKELNDKLSDLQTSVAVIQERKERVDRLEANVVALDVRIRDLTERLSTIKLTEQQVTILNANIQQLRQELQELKRQK